MSGTAGSANPVITAGLLEQPMPDVTLVRAPVFPKSICCLYIVKILLHTSAEFANAVEPLAMHISLLMCS